MHARGKNCCVTIIIKTDVWVEIGMRDCLRNNDSGLTAWTEWPPGMHSVPHIENHWGLVVIAKWSPQNMSLFQLCKKFLSPITIFLK